MNTMKLVVFVVLMLITAVLSVQIEPRIVGGKNANPTDFKYQVKIQITPKSRPYDTEICGGSVIHKNWILTAAHCVKNGIDFKVNLGPKMDNTFSKVVTAKKAIPHISFSFKRTINDIALLEIPTIEYGDSIQEIALSNKNTASLAGKTLTLAGWGVINSALHLPTKLQYTTLMFMTSKECKMYYRPFQDDQHFCTFHPTSNCCVGDSGSPLVTGFGANAVQVGLVSHGKEKCTPGIPSVQTNVAFFLPWIKSNTNIIF